MAKGHLLLSGKGTNVCHSLSDQNHHTYLRSKFGNQINSAFHPYRVGKSAWPGLMLGTFTCIGRQVTLCDPMWQVTLRSSVMGSNEELNFLPSTEQQLRAMATMAYIFTEVIILSNFFRSLSSLR